MGELRGRVSRLEEQLRSLEESEGSLRNIFNCIQDGISMLDTELNIIRVNSAMESWYGRDILGKKCYQAYHGRPEPCENCPSIRAIREKTVQKGVVKDRKGWRELHVYPMFDSAGGVTGVIEDVRDINVRKKAEDALQESEEKFRQMAENINEVFFMFTPDWKRTIYVSPAYEQIWGRPLDGVYNDPMDWLKGVYPEDVNAPLSVVNDNKSGRIPETRNVEFRIRRPDGSVRWIQARTYPVRDEAGNVHRITGIAEDVTERKRAEEALLESEERFRAAFEQAAVGMSQVSLDGRIMRINQKMCEITGYAAGELTRMAIRDITYPPDMPEENVKLKKLLDGEADTFSRDKRYIRKDGSLVWVNLTASVIRDNGAPKYFIGVVQDISKRKRTEDELRKLSRAVEESPAVVMITDLKGDIEYVNPRFTQLTGFTLDEAKGKNPRILKSGETPQEEYRRLWDTITSGNEWRGEFRNKKKSGELYWESAIIAPIKDGEGRITNYIAIKEDITGRRRAGEALKNSEAQFKAIFENAGAAIFIADKETGAIIECNSNAERLVGRGRSEIIGMHQSRLHPEGEEEKYRAIFASHGPDNGHKDVEGEVQHKDGRRIPVWINAQPLRIDGRDMLIGFFFDITERKGAEKELQEAKAETELYIDLMGHDINNMNQITMGFLELAHNVIDYEGKLDRNSAYLLDKATESLENSSRLIDNVRKLQREKTGQYTPTVMDLGKTLEEVMELFRHVPGRDITISHEISGGCRVRANELLKDIFINLAGNSIKHSTGPLSLNIELDTVTADGVRYCRVVVEDDGPGIPDSLKKTLFDRLNLSNTRARGKGFGLCLIKMLVDSYRGKFWVEDRVPGDSTQGARFVVMLPAVEQ